MKNIKKITGSILLTFALFIGSVFSANTGVEAAKLKLNNNIKLNKTKTYTKTGLYQESTLFPTNKKIKVKYTIKCSRKSSGKNYKVTYNVNYKYLENPKIEIDEISYDDFYWGLTEPNPLYTVFSYKTGKSLENKNDLGVKVKSSKWKVKYYPKQIIRYPDELRKLNDGDAWFSARKTISYSFTVTYPKKCKKICVGIGFVNSDHMDDPAYNKNHVNNKYWDGKVSYIKTDIYKKGKNTMSYMRLNK